ncbi:MAG: T9SS type A sorting domain-containing protein [Flavobacteriales bacterium]|nr:T9SS type A sorting domain-containing protein [Flavobacteriales bacterium]
MSILRSAVLSIPLMACADVFAQSQEPFHHRYAHAQFPALEERYLPLPSGSTVFYGSGHVSPMYASLGMLDAQGGLLWERRVEFDGIGEADVRAVRDLSNGTLLCGVRGTITSAGAVALVDTFGTLLWSADLGMPISDVVLTADGNCVALGWRSATAAGPGGAYDIHLMKLDLDGNLLWTKRYPVTGLEFADKFSYDLLEQLNGDLWLCFGYNDRLGVLCTDAAGDIQWVKYYASGLSQYDILAGGSPYALLREGSGAWLFGKGNEGLGLGGLFAILLDGQGTAVSGRTYSGSQFLYLREVERAPDGSIWMFARDGQYALFINLDNAAAILGQFRLSEGGSAPVSGFGLAADGALLTARWGAITDSLLSNAPCERERFYSSSTLECDEMLSSNIAQNDFIPLASSLPSLVMTQGVEFPSMQLGLAPRTVTVSPGCVPTDLTETRAATVAIRAYPSPATDWVRFSGIDPAYPITVELVDLHGRQWKHKIAGEASLMIHDLAPGVYTAMFLTETGDPATVRFIKAERPD